MCKKAILILSIFSFMSICSAQMLVPDSVKVDSAKMSAESWLKLIDQEKYAESWEQTSKLFKSQVTKKQWVSTISNLISSYGKADNRGFLSGQYSTSLPGAPKGEYVIIQFKVNFELKGKSIETVTPMKDTDGQWRVSGYFIK